MSDEPKEPRRYKLPSELTDDDRAAKARLGASGKVERDEYRKWRKRTLASERDDLDLRGRLLHEEAEHQRERAAACKSAAVEGLSIEDHMARAAAKVDGAEVDIPDGGAAAFEAEAAELDSEAQQIDQFLAETKEIA
jgi:hypothetical protein